MLEIVESQAAGWLPPFRYAQSFSILAEYARHMAFKFANLTNKQSLPYCGGEQNPAGEVAPWCAHHAAFWRKRRQCKRTQPGFCLDTAGKRTESLLNQNRRPSGTSAPRLPAKRSVLHRLEEIKTGAAGRKKSVRLHAKQDKGPGIGQRALLC